MMVRHAALALHLVLATGGLAHGAALAEPGERPGAVAAAVESMEAQGVHVPDVHPAWILPFVILLGCIATMPLLRPKFWEHNYPYVAIGLGALVAAYYLFVFDDPAARTAWLLEMREYMSFIALLASLFIVSGGIVIHISRKATATTNTLLLLIGAIIANVFGTTGAAMLLIRPYLRINRGHLKPYHVVFFIFIVANCGGVLTPIGDPPLFVGFLKGVPFLWVLQACWPMWAMCVGLLLAIFFMIDWRDHARFERRPHEHQSDAGRAVEIFGFQNFLFIGVILLAVFQKSIFERIGAGEYPQIVFSREVLMLLAAVASKLTTRRPIYERNGFTFGPIREVAILFVGIFSTMVPALNYLNRHAEEMPLKSPGHYYFGSGVLSAVLDNAPTYLVFLETRLGQVEREGWREIASVRSVLDAHMNGGAAPAPTTLEPAVRDAYETLLRYNRKAVERGQVRDADIHIALMISGRELAAYLIAISLGSVFFGACTYIGNGPNFMVKSIAQASGARTPTFFGYVLRYTLPVLVPIYTLVWIVFFLLPGRI